MLLVVSYCWAELTPTTVSSFLFSFLDPLLFPLLSLLPPSSFLAFSFIHFLLSCEVTGTPTYVPLTSQTYWQFKMDDISVRSTSTGYCGTTGCAAIAGIILLFSYITIINNIFFFAFSFCLILIIRHWYKFDCWSLRRNPRFEPVSHSFYNDFYYSFFLIVILIIV